MAYDVETAIANVFGNSLPEDDIDDESVMISDYAVSFGSLHDYLYLENEVSALNASGYIESRVDEIERLISTVRLTMKVFLESTVPAIWMIRISSRLPRHTVC